MNSCFSLFKCILPGVRNRVGADDYGMFLVLLGISTPMCYCFLKAMLITLSMTMGCFNTSLKGRVGK